MYSDRSDADLVIAARDGDKAAFGQLIDRHQPMMLALCRRALSDPDFADDVAQEAVLQALLSIDRLKKPDCFGPWLAGIGLNLCRRALQDRNRQTLSWEALDGGRRLAGLAEDPGNPEELAEAAQAGARVRSAIASLPSGQRNAVVLHYLAGLTQAEMAALLGINVGAVKTRLHKARRALRERLMSQWKEDRMVSRTDTTSVEMRVADVRRQPAKEGEIPRNVVVLEEVAGTRRLLIWVGPFEGTAIALHLEKVEVPRPLTFMFMADLLRSLGGVLREVRISKLVGDTYYAQAVIEGAEGTRTVDARPSDALSVALVAGAPISAEIAVLEAAADWEAKKHPLREEIFGEGTLGRAEIVEEMKSIWSQQGPRQ